MNELTSDDILGKEAVDPDGTILGTIVKLHISNNDRQITGITIDSGFMKPDLFVGINHVKKFGVDAVLLNTPPIDKVKGLTVLTSDGNEVGVVKEIEKHGKRLKRIIIQPKGFNRETIKISSNQIKSLGGSVVLKPGIKL